MFESVKNYFSAEMRVERKEARAKRRKEKRDAEIAYYNKVLNESNRITSTQELGDVYYNSPKGTICFLNDKNVFVKEYDTYPTWRRKQVNHKMQYIYDRPWTDSDGDNDYTKDFYPNKKIRQELKRVMEQGEKLTEAEEHIAKRSPFKSFLIGLSWFIFLIVLEFIMS